MEVAKMRGPGFGILLLLVAAALITMLTSCASELYTCREHVRDNVYRDCKRLE